MIIPCKSKMLSYHFALFFFSPNFFWSRLCTLKYPEGTNKTHKKNLPKKMLEMLDVEIDFSIKQQVVCVFVMQKEIWNVIRAMLCTAQ